jgi:hypothetical protein
MRTTACRPCSLIPCLKITMPLNAMPLLLSAIAASATNRLLALELYFKAILIGGDLPVPANHDLKVLWDALPADARAVITACYDERSNAVNPDMPLSLIACFQHGTRVDDKAIREAHSKKPVPATLPALLDRNRHGFVVTRYLFEKASRERPSLFEYDFRRLGVICEAMSEILQNSLRKESDLGRVNEAEQASTAAEAP